MVYRIIKILLISQFLFVYQGIGQTVLYSDTISMNHLRSKFDLFSGDEYHYLYTVKGGLPIIKLYDQKLRSKSEVVLDFLEGNLLQSHFVFKQKHIYGFWIVEQHRNLTLRLAILNQEGLLESYQSFDLRGLNLNDWRNSAWTQAISPHQEYMGFALSNYRKGEVHLMKFDIESAHLHYIKANLPEIPNRRRGEEQIIFDKSAMYWFQIPSDMTWNKSEEQINAYQWQHGVSEITNLIIPKPEAYIGHQKVFYDIELDEIGIASLLSEKKNTTIDKINIQYLNLPINQQIVVEDYIKKSINIQRKKNDLYDFRIENITKTEGGGYLVGLQVHFVLNKNYAASNMMGFAINSIHQRSIREFYFGEYIGIQSHPVDSLNWQNIIRKSQLTEDDYGIFSSLALLNSGSQMIVFYNDLHMKRNQIQIGVLEANGDVIYGQIPRTIKRPTYYAVSELVYDFSPTAFIVPVVYSTNAIGLMMVSFKDDNL